MPRIVVADNRLRTGGGPRLAPPEPPGLVRSSVSWVSTIVRAARILVPLVGLGLLLSLVDYQASSSLTIGALSGVATGLVLLGLFWMRAERDALLASVDGSEDLAVGITDPLHPNSSLRYYGPYCPIESGDDRAVTRVTRSAPPSAQSRAAAGR